MLTIPSVAMSVPGYPDVSVPSIENDESRVPALTLLCGHVLVQIVSVPCTCFSDAEALVSLSVLKRLCGHGLSQLTPTFPVVFCVFWYKPRVLCPGTNSAFSGHVLFLFRVFQ